MTIKFYVNGSGNYIGGFDGATGIDVSAYTEVPSAPINATDTWSGSSWIAHPELRYTPDNNSTNAVMYPTWVTGANAVNINFSSTKLYFNPSTGILFAAGFSGPIVSAPTFISSDQPITAGGSLTLSHGLGAAPKFINSFLVCQSDDGGYVAGDVVWSNDYARGNGQGISVKMTSTILFVRFGAGTGTGNSVMSIPDGSNGGVANLVNSKWKIRFLVGI